MKTVCVIQGNIRSNFNLVLGEMTRHFDRVVVSTWKQDAERVPRGDFDLVLSEKPASAGLTNRNLQRCTAARGIEAARRLGCDFVLKWRTDMLPTRLNTAKLIDASIKQKPADVNFPSRIVTCGFRNLTVDVDCFSSIPDLFAFGHIDMMEILWGDEGFDYSARINFPQSFHERYQTHRYDDIGALYCAESELYALFKLRIERILGRQMDHEEIVKNYFHLINHEDMKICWFDSDGGFRSIAQAWEFPWWKANNSHWYRPQRISPGYPVSKIWQKIMIHYSPYGIQRSIAKQKKWYRAYCTANKASHHS